MFTALWILGWTCWRGGPSSRVRILLAHDCIDLIELARKRAVSLLAPLVLCTLRHATLLNAKV
jgi:hypothetical protein